MLFVIRRILSANYLVRFIQQLSHTEKRGTKSFCAMQGEIGSLSGDFSKWKLIKLIIWKSFLFLSRSSFVIKSSHNRSWLELNGFIKSYRKSLKTKPDRSRFPKKISWQFRCAKKTSSYECLAQWKEKFDSLYLPKERMGNTQNISLIKYFYQTRTEWVSEYFFRPFSLHRFSISSFLLRVASTGHCDHTNILIAHFKRVSNAPFW